MNEIYYTFNYAFHLELSVVNTILKNWPLEKSTGLWLRLQNSPVLSQAMEPYIPSYTVSLWRNEFSNLVWLSMIYRVHTCHRGSHRSSTPARGC